MSTRFNRDLGSFEPIADQLDLAFEEVKLKIDRNFFEHPRDLAILSAIRQPFAHFLIGIGVSEIDARSVAGRLESYFVLALHSEWRRRSKEYQAVLNELEGSPFAAAGEREHKWREYAAWLDRQPDEPVFDEAFGLRQVYIPLRAYWAEPKKDYDENHAPRNPEHLRKDAVRHVVDLETELVSWVDAAVVGDLRWAR